MTFNDCVVLFGGRSEERHVSVASAQNIARNIPEAKLWYLSQEGAIHEVSQEELAAFQNAFINQFRAQSAPLFSSLKEALSVLAGKVVIMGLHGTEGEDGQIQKLLEDAGVKFTGTGPKASAVAFDKYLTKEAARKNGLPVVEELIVRSFTGDAGYKLKAFLDKHHKVVLKPVANGSSVGLFIISTHEELSTALLKLETSKDQYICEPFITGREITVGVKQTKDGSLKALPCSEVRVVQGRQFDYNGKYLGSGVEELTPAPINAEETRRCQSLALKMHEILGCRGYSRTDMILAESGPVLLETNTLPGMTKASFVPQQLEAAGENLRDFFFEQINLE